MANFTGMKCPVCLEKFTKDADIVVCPECGAPHHRHCWQATGHCINEAAHAKGEAWKPEPDPATTDPFESRRCSRCGTLNPAHGLFCEICGNPLSGEAGAEQAPPREGDPNVPPFARSMPYNPFINPLAGLDAEEKIAGVTVKELAIYLGESTHYFLPQFKRMESGSKLSWNWASFFFGYLYFAFRKLNIWAVALLALTILVDLPSMILYLNDVMLQLNGQSIIGDAVVSRMDSLYLITSMLSMFIRFATGLLFNMLYMRTAIAKIKAIRARFNDHPGYHEELAKSGGVSRLGVAMMVVATFLAYMTAMIVFVSSIF